MNHNTSPFFFIQITDPQLGMFTANEDFTKEVILLRRAVEHINRLRPAFVILTGDLINEPADETQTAEALRLLKEISPDIPLRILPGNHDIGDYPTPEILQWFRSRISPDWSSFNHANWHFVLLNSNIIQHPDKAPLETEKQWQWLLRDLDSSPQKNTPRNIVFMHHPLFLETADEPDQYFNIPLKTRKKYLDLFQKHQIKTVINGHLHQNNIASWNEMQIITTGPIGMPLGNAPSGLRIFTLNHNSLSHQYYDLSAVPDAVPIQGTIP